MRAIALLAIAVAACKSATPAQVPSTDPSASASGASTTPPTDVTTATTTSASAAPDATASAPTAPSGPGVSVGKIESPPDWDVKAIVRQNISKLDDCWNAVLKKTPRERGKLSVRFVVNPEGKVTKVEEVSSTFRDPGLSQCVQGAVKQIPWPPPSGTATVVLPLVFRS